MLRLIRRAGLLFGAYAGVLFAVVIAGFLAEAVGIWAAIAWGAALVAIAVVYRRRRLSSDAPR
jgi:hypothetical protein